jgi:hypothetical protein
MVKIPVLFFQVTASRETIPPLLPQNDSFRGASRGIFRFITQQKGLLNSHEL